jgi:enoyl-CoA hydratase
VTTNTHGSPVSFLPMDPGDRGILEFHRPEKANAVDLASMHALEEAVAAIPDDMRLVVLRGGGSRSFISGGDIAAMRAMGVAEAAEFARAGQRLTRALETHRVVFGALVDGYALGGGTELALACDVLVATPAAVFGLPEVRLGILPGWGGTQRLVRAVGLHRGLRYLTSGARFDAADAERLGIVSAVLPDTAAALAWWSAFAGELRAAAPSASALAKRAARQGVETNIDNGLSIELGEWLDQFASEDRTEGMSAFLAKRPAAWTNVRPPI